MRGRLALVKHGACHIRSGWSRRAFAHEEHALSAGFVQRRSTFLSAASNSLDCAWKNAANRVEDAAVAWEGRLRAALSEWLGRCERSL